MGSLIDEIRSGNKDAVRTIYQEYAKDVYNFAKSITGDHDSALAATKKTFVKLFNSIKKGETPDNIRTALLKVAYDEACAIAMPSGSKQTTDKVAERGNISSPQKTQQKREEIYMPKGGYDSLKVEDNNESDIAEVERRPASRRPRPENAPRRRRPVVNEVTEEVEEIQEEATPVVVPVVDDNIQEEFSRTERRPRRKADPVIEDFEEDEEEYVEERPRRKKSSKSRKYEDEYEDEEDVDVYDPLDDSDEYEYDDEDEEEDNIKPRNKGLFIFCIILNVVLILILLWFLCGLLVNLSVLPEIDLGYTWFNSHIYPLF